MFNISFLLPSMVTLWSLFYLSYLPIPGPGSSHDAFDDLTADGSRGGNGSRGSLTSSSRRHRSRTSSAATADELPDAFDAIAGGAGGVSGASGLGEGADGKGESEESKAEQVEAEDTPLSAANHLHYAQVRGSTFVKWYVSIFLNDWRERAYP